MSQNITPPHELKVVSKECRFAVYIPPPEHGMPDMHFIKEILHMSDGSVKPNTIMISDWQRPYWITKKGCQTHDQKKEWEKKENLIEGRSTQTNLVYSIAKSLGTPYFKGNLRKLCKSPYVYGCDILSTAIIKKTYQDKYPIIPTKYNVAVFDTETDVLGGTGDVIMATFTYKNIVHTAVVKSFVSGLADVQNRVDRLMDKYLGEYVEKRKLISKLVIVDTPLQAIKSCIDKAHETKPDFLAIWNITFDIEKTMMACMKEGVNIADIFSDPSVPKAYRYFNFKKGPHQKVTASGLTTPIKPAAQWHTVVCPSSFYIIDAMCVFKHNRIGQPEKQSYALDFILNDVLGIRKLKFKEADKYIKLQWHEFMQSNYKLEYIIYNRFDCISIEELDEKTNDMSLTFPLFSGFSDFVNFKSEPRRTVDNLHYFVMDKGYIIGSTGSETATEMDAETYDLGGWIVALPAHLVADNGLKCIEEYPDLVTNLRCHIGDLDVSAALI